MNKLEFREIAAQGAAQVSIGMMGTIVPQVIKNRGFFIFPMTISAGVLVLIQSIVSACLEKVIQQAYQIGDKCENWMKVATRIAAMAVATGFALLVAPYLLPAMGLGALSTSAILIGGVVQALGIEIFHYCISIREQIEIPIENERADEKNNLEETVLQEKVPQSQTEEQLKKSSISLKKVSKKAYDLVSIPMSILKSAVKTEKWEKILPSGFISTLKEQVQKKVEPLNKRILVPCKKGVEWVIRRPISDKTWGLSLGVVAICGAGGIYYKVPFAVFRGGAVLSLLGTVAFLGKYFFDQGIKEASNTKKIKKVHFNEQNQLRHIRTQKDSNGAIQDQTLSATVHTVPINS